MFYSKKNIYIYLSAVIIFLAAVLADIACASNANFELKGTVFTASLEPAAIIKDLSSGKTSIYAKGEKIGDISVVDIKRGQVVLEQGKTRYIIGLPGGNVGQPDSNNNFYAFDINADEIKQDNDIYYVNANSADNILANIPKIIKDIKIMPHFANGLMQGLRITSIKQAGILEKAGVKEGDVVKAINGMAVKTPNQIFNAYQSLKQEKSFAVEVTRGGKQIVLNYAIR